MKEILKIKKKEGKGVYFYNNGKVEVGNYKNDKYLGE